MRPLKSLAICSVVCAFLLGMAAAPVSAEGGWAGNPPQKNKPDWPPHESIGPTCYAQPMALDDSPWVDPPRRRNKPDPDIPAIGSLAWWMQMAVDGRPWDDEDRPGKNSPKE